MKTQHSILVKKPKAIYVYHWTGLTKDINQTKKTNNLLAGVRQEPVKNV